MSNKRYRFDRIFYILDTDDRTPIPAENEIAWAEWFEAHQNERIVRQEHLGGYFISTVFIGLDASSGLGGLKVFETMIFSPTGDAMDRKRCATWAEAEQMHEELAGNLRRTVNN